MAKHDRVTRDQELIQALQAIVGKEYVTDGATARSAGIDGVIPQVAVYPADAAEIGEVLAYANQRRLSVLPIGGGTQLGLGHPPERADIALFLSRLDQIVAHEPADMTVTVQAGMSMAALQSHLARFGQCLPYDPPLPGRATIGGVVATREAGPLRQMFRGVADRLLGIQVVTAEGKLVKAGGRVVKNVTGYEMGRLYTGSMGTLAVIIEVTFKVQPRFETAEALAVAFPDLSAAGRAIRALLDSDAEPVMLELVGPVELGANASGSLVEKLANLNDEASKPGAAQGGLLLVGYAGTPEEVAWQLDEAERIVAQEFADGNVRHQRVAWDVAHDAVLRAHRSDAERVITVTANAPSQVAAEAEASGTPYMGVTQPVGTAKSGSAAAAVPETAEPGDARVTLRAHMRATEVPDFIAAAHDLTSDLGGLTYAAHAGTGVVRVHLPEGDQEKVATTVDSLRERSVEAGGFLVVERASPALKRRISVFGPPRNDFFLHKAIKERLDPNRILNPGRFIGNL